MKSVCLCVYVCVTCPLLPPASSRHHWAEAETPHVEPAHLASAWAQQKHTEGTNQSSFLNRVFFSNSSLIEYLVALTSDILYVWVPLLFIMINNWYVLILLGLFTCNIFTLGFCYSNKESVTLLSVHLVARPSTKLSFDEQLHVRPEQYGFAGILHRTLYACLMVVRTVY